MLLVLIFSAVAIAAEEGIQTIEASLVKTDDVKEITTLIEKGIDHISHHTEYDLDNELSFQNAAINACGKLARDKNTGKIDFERAKALVRDYFERITGIMKQKYDNNAYALLTICMKEDTFYRQLSPDFEKQRDALDRAERQAADLTAELAVISLQLKLDRARNIISLKLDKNENEKEKMKDLLFEIVDFPILKMEYRTRIEDIKRIYTSAAVLLVSILRVNELQTIRLYPFALIKVNEIFPEKGKYISDDDPGSQRVRKSIGIWLAATAANLREDNPLKKQLEEILKAMQAGIL
jgi:hypothetical protein